VRGRVLVLVLVFALLLACTAGLVRRADANFIGVFEGLPSIIIQSDGSVVPQTEYVTREGNVYKLTADLQQTYVININCSNIIFDGQDHVINGSGNVFWNNIWYGYNCEGITMEGQSNVTVKDITIFGFTKPGVLIDKCSEISLTKLQTESIRLLQSSNSDISYCTTGVYLLSSEQNALFKNNITALLVSLSSNNTIYQNNINVLDPKTHGQITGSGFINFWDNGTIGNYWSDYSDRYPDASEIGNTGIANLPYLINENNVDSYPLMRPVIIEQEAEAAPFLLTLFAGVSAVLMAGAAAGLVYYKKHDSRRKSGSRIAE
jgi:hypothetical protein